MWSVDHIHAKRSGQASFQYGFRSSTRSSSKFTKPAASTGRKAAMVAATTSAGAIHSPCASDGVFDTAVRRATLISAAPTKTTGPAGQLVIQIVNEIQMS